MNIFENHETYFDAVLKRNSETHEDGHMVVFKFDETLLKNKIKYFNKCCDEHLSPYKALVFLDLEMN
jgi:hypothetical protein